MCRNGCKTGTAITREKRRKIPKGAKKSDIGKIIRGGCFSNLPQYNKP